MIYFLLIALPLMSASTGSYNYRYQTGGSQPGFQTYINNRGFQNSPRMVLPTFNHLANTYQTFVKQTNNVAPNSMIQQTDNVASNSMIKQTDDVASPSVVLQTNNVAPHSMIQQAKNAASTVTSYLRTLSAEPSSGAAIDRMIRDLHLPCLSNFEEAIENFQSSNDLVDSFGPLADKFKSLVPVKEPTKMLRETAAMMRLMVPLEEKTRMLTDKCQAEVGQRSLGVMLTQMSNNQGLNISQEVRENMRKAATVIFNVTPFITQLKSTSARLEKFCTGGAQFSIASLSAFGDLTEQMAQMFSSLGDDKAGETFRYGKLYIDRVTVELRKQEDRQLDLELKDFNFGMGRNGTECSTGNLAASADILEDFAFVVQDVGIEKLQEQLGESLGYVESDFDFRF